MTRRTSVWHGNLKTTGSRDVTGRFVATGLQPGLVEMVSEKRPPLVGDRSRRGRQAVTHWQVLQRYEQDQMSLLDLTLETGRTHQIRVHLATEHHPVVGDPLYAGSGRISRITDMRLRNMVQHLNRQFLHAWQLGFEHPDGRRMMFQASLPQELQSVLDYLNAKHHVFQPEDDIVPYAGMMEENSDENR